MSYTLGVDQPWKGPHAGAGAGYPAGHTLPPVLADVRRTRVRTPCTTLQIVLGKSEIVFKS